MPLPPSTPPVHAVSPGDGPCADVAAALAAGLLPCMTQALGRVGAGSVGGSVWVPPDAFAGIAHTRGAGTGPAAGPLTLGFWQQLLLFGEQDQVNGFLAALGRCVEEAVEQLCVVASPRGRRKGGCGEAEWRVAVAGELLGFAAQRLNDMLRCAQAVATVASTQGQAGVGRENVGRAAGRGGSSEEGMRVWEEGAHEGIIRRAAKVLLPSAVSAVRTCVELMGAGRGSTSSSSSSSSSSSGNRLGPLLPALAACGEGVTRYLALLCSRVGGVAAAAEAAATVGANAPASHWTAQLVMEQLPLMGVLGDAVALWQMGADGGWDREPLRCGLAGALPLAAAVFPAQFRATVGKEVGKGAVRKLQGMGSLGCISMVGVQQVLGAGPGAGTGSGAGAGELLGVVRRVAAGWNPTPVEVCEVEAGLELAWC